MATNVTNPSKPQITKFYFVPACDTDADANDVIPGQIGSHLNGTGKEQAAKVAKKLSSLPFSTIYCSDNANAKKTASFIIGKERTCQIFFVKALREFNFGVLEGRPYSDYRDILDKAIASQNYNTLEKRSSFRVADGAENVEDAFVRVARLLKIIASKNKEENIVIVSHVKLISSFVAALLERDIDAVKVEKKGLVVIAKRLDNFYFFDGKKVSLAGKTPQEGLFEPSLLFEDIHEGWGGYADSDLDVEKFYLLKQQFTVLADRHFSENNARDIREVLAGMYKNVITPQLKKRATVLKERYHTELHKYIKTILIGSTKGYSNVLNGRISPEAPYINKLLLRLYEYGDTAALPSYILHLYNYFGSEKERTRFILEWTQKVHRDFLDRKPVSFPMMAKLLHERQISYISIADISPFNDVKASFEILKKLSDLKVTEAEDALTEVYRWDIIGSDNNEVKLNLSTQERIIGLEQLAEQGHEGAKRAFGEILYFNEFDSETPCNFTDQKRRSGMIRFQKNEEKDLRHITNLYWSNAFDKKPLNFSIQSRIEGLYARAREGDLKALNYLLVMYECNALGDQQITPLELSVQERISKIQELETIAKDFGEISLNMINKCFITMIKENALGEGKNKIFLDWSLEERIKWFEEAAKKNSIAQEVLAVAYRDNRLGDRKEDDLNLAAEDRLAKLHDLACQGCYKAARLVFGFYTDSNSDECEKIKGANPTTMDAETKRSKFNEVILKGKHYEMGKSFLMMREEEPYQETKKLLLSTLQMLKESLV